MPEKATFNLKTKGEEVSDTKGNVIIPTLQEIEQPNGNKYEFVVLSKLKRNVDGTQTGNAKTVFIPVHMASEVMKQVNTLIKKS